MTTPWEERMSAILRLVAVAALLATLSACAPAVAPGQGGGNGAEMSRGPKVLTLVGREGLIPDLPGQAGRTSLSGGNFVHDFLTDRDASDRIVGRVAEPISVESGT